MDRDQLDDLYHLLRVASNTKVPRTYDINLHQVIIGMTRHLLAGGDYLALVQYSAYYGEQYLLPRAAQVLVEAGWDESIDRVVEFGAGLGWLARGLGHLLSVPAFSFDKRPWGGIDKYADLETQEGRDCVVAELKDGDIIVMCDFLHCLSNAFDILAEFSSYPMLILEYSPSDPDYAESYAVQLERYGASTFSKDDLDTLFFGIETLRVDIDPYVMILADRR